MLTQEHLKEILQYDKNTGDFFWLKPASNRAKVGQKAGTMSHGYIYIAIDGKKYGAHRLAWLYSYGEITKEIIDHIDGNPSNNCLSNLREATKQQNLHNLKKPITNTSGYKGVHFHKGSSKWRAVVTVNNKPKHLGMFQTPEEASVAYNNWCIANRGEFAWVNK
jgi:hypothetical protein